MADKKKSAEFLQGFACGWCLCVDAIRNQGMETLPHPAAQGMVACADAMEAFFKSSGLGELLGPYQTDELRAGLLAMILSKKPAAKQTEAVAITDARTEVG